MNTLDLRLDIGKRAANAPVDSRFNEDHAEFRVHVFSVEGEVLVNGNCLLHQVVEIFGDFRCEVCEIIR